MLVVELLHILHQPVSSLFLGVSSGLGHLLLVPDPQRLNLRCLLSGKLLQSLRWLVIGVTLQPLLPEPVLLGHKILEFLGMQRAQVVQAVPEVFVGLGILLEQLDLLGVDRPQLGQI